MSPVQIGSGRARPERSRLFVIALLAIAAHGCGGSPTTPPPPPPVPALTIACPIAAPVESPDGSPVPVSFGPATSSGGVAPITTSCSAASGSVFPAGVSNVQCTATDARGVTATCGFAVTVLPPPRLTSTRFVAFGDSLTSGTLAVTPTLLVATSDFDYPRALQARLRARYRQQSIDVVNEGLPGETVSEGGDLRFRSALLQHQPGVVLIMEGTNDLLEPNKERAMTFAINALAGMIREAKSQNVRIALATIPPQRPDGPRNRGAVAAVIPGFNDRIRALAAAEGVTLVDVYDAMKDDLSLIGLDDLHPTPRGYEVITDTFFEAIRAAFEERVTPAPGALR